MKTARSTLGEVVRRSEVADIQQQAAAERLGNCRDECMDALLPGDDFFLDTVTTGAAQAVERDAVARCRTYRAQRARLEIGRVVKLQDVELVRAAHPRCLAHNRRGLALDAGVETAAAAGPRFWTHGENDNFEMIILAARLVHDAVIQKHVQLAPQQIALQLAPMQVVHACFALESRIFCFGSGAHVRVQHGIEIGLLFKVLLFQVRPLLLVPRVQLLQADSRGYHLFLILLHPL